jgi:hypothetical protein
MSQLAFSYTLIQHHTSIPLPEPQKHGFTPKMVVTRMSHWEVIRSTSVSWGRPDFEPGFLPVQWMYSPSLPGSCTSLGSVVHLRPLTLIRWEDESPSGSNCPLAPGGISSWQSRGTHPSDKGGDNSPSPQSWMSPQEMLWGFASWDTGFEAISRKQCFIVPAQTQCTHVQRLSPRTKGSLLPYIPLQAGYRSKKQGIIHIWLYLILLATLP